MREAEVNNVKTNDAEKPKVIKKNFSFSFSTFWFSKKRFQTLSLCCRSSHLTSGSGRPPPANGKGDNPKENIYERNWQFSSSVVIPSPFSLLYRKKRKFK